MRLLNISAWAALLIAAVGCRSRVVRVELTNTSPQPLYTIVVDYPGATFGVNQLAPGKSYQYAIKPQDTGFLKIQFIDAAGASHSYSGPTLHVNDEGSVRVALTQASASAEPALH
ncbi:MAG TPA: hypothetical protein VFL42_06900 [Terriglobales bacterium]|jgi:hypothetical protein|nr:hypothetical protein [Terriglobales bacterium]